MCVFEIKCNLYFTGLGQLNDVEYQAFENTPLKELKERHALYSKWGPIARKPRTTKSKTITEKTKCILPDSEPTGNFFPGETNTILNAESSSIKDELTESETQRDMATETPTNSQKEDIEFVPSNLTAIESKSEPAVSEDEESAFVCASVHSSEGDAEQCLTAQRNISQSTGKLGSCSSKNIKRKKTVMPPVRRSKRICDKGSSISYRELVADELFEEKLVAVETSPQVKVGGKRKENIKGFLCDICNWTFKRRKTYNNHLFTDRCILRCSYCPKVFPFRGGGKNFRNHMKRHNKQYDFKCEDCGRQFIQKQHFLRHMLKAHSKDRPYKCENCLKTFKSELDLTLHKLTDHGEDGIYPCPKCTKVFQRPKNLRNHVIYTHLSGEDLLLPCSFCGKLFSGRSLQSHVTLMHTLKKDFKCDKCSSAFKKATLLRAHMKRHTKSYSVYCEICGRGCYSLTELRHHLRTHSGEKPFGCNQCDYRCAIKTNLKKHMAVHNKLD